MISFKSLVASDIVNEKPSVEYVIPLVKVYRDVELGPAIAVKAVISRDCASTGSLKLMVICSRLRSTATDSKIGLPSSAV